MKSILSFVWEIGKVFLVALLIVVPLRALVFQPFLVRGDSMEPNFHNGDYLIVDEFSYRLGSPSRGEVIVFRFPDDPSKRYIKRIIGLPGETVAIEEGRVMISNLERTFVLNESEYFFDHVSTPGLLKTKLHENEYFVLGDNRPYSSDSRAWGVLSRKHIIGRVLIRMFPLSAFAKVEAPTY